MPPSSVRILILAGVVSPIVSWGLSVVVIARWPSYDPVAQSISLLANAPLGWLQTLAFALTGALGVAWALGLSAVLGVTALARGSVRWLLVFQALLGFGFALLPTDPDGIPVSTIGALHLIDFYLYALMMPLTLVALGLVMRRDPRWRGAVRPTLVAATTVVVSSALVPATVDGILTPWLGLLERLLERLYVAIPSVWQVGAALVALRLARELEPS